jgi:hypothetical protein
MFRRSVRRTRHSRESQAHQPKQPQGAGRLVMWVPGGLMLWIAVTVVYFRWTVPEVAEDEGRARKLARAGKAIKPPPFPAQPQS